jgi:hypothetical protein
MRLVAVQHPSRRSNTGPRAAHRLSRSSNTGPTAAHRPSRRSNTRSDGGASVGGRRVDQRHLQQEPPHTDQGEVDPRGGQLLLDRGAGAQQVGAASATPQTMVDAGRENQPISDRRRGCIEQRLWRRSNTGSRRQRNTHREAPTRVRRRRIARRDAPTQVRQQRIDQRLRRSSDAVGGRRVVQRRLQQEPPRTDQGEVDRREVNFSLIAVPAPNRWEPPVLHHRRWSMHSRKTNPYRTAAKGASTNVRVGRRPNTGSRRHSAHREAPTHEPQRQRIDQRQQQSSNTGPRPNHATSFADQQRKGAPYA